MSISQWTVTYNHVMEYYAAQKYNVDVHLWTWMLFLKDNEMRKSVLVWFYFCKKNICVVGLLNMHTKKSGRICINMFNNDHLWVVGLCVSFVLVSLSNVYFNLNTDRFYNRNKLTESNPMNKTNTQGLKLSPGPIHYHTVITQREIPKHVEVS